MDAQAKIITPPSPQVIVDNGIGNTGSNESVVPPPPERRSKSAILRQTCSESICSCFKTLLGPKAPSFLWCCCICRNEKKLPCSWASTATKTMNLMLLLVITILSCLFIIPPNVLRQKDTSDVDFIAPAYFFPCGDEASTATKTNFKFFPVDGFWENCRGHAGYFFVYRFFFCLTSYYTIMSLITFHITSTKASPKRASLHRGFWCYKLVILGGLLLIACLAIRVYSDGAFESVMMWVGLIGAYFFAIIEVVCVLDAVELLVVKSKSLLAPKRYKTFYWIWTGINYFVATAAIILIGLIYTWRNYSAVLDRTIGSGKDRVFFNGIDEEEYKPGDTGAPSLCMVHVGLLIYATFIGLFVTMIIAFVKPRTDGRRFPNLGFLQASIIFVYTVFQTWSAMSNSTDIECRYVFFPYNPYEKNKDVTFTPQGLLNGLIGVFAIVYYTYASGPKSKAPWTVAFNKLWYLTSGHPAPSEDEPPEPLTAWNDEKKHVTYSWPLFYITLILGSLSLMMSMTNYANPDAGSAAAGNEAALVMKILATVTCAMFFIAPILKSCKSVYPDEEFPLPGVDASPESAKETDDGTTKEKNEKQVQKSLDQPESPSPSPPTTPPIATSLSETRSPV